MFDAGNRIGLPKSGAVVCHFWDDEGVVYDDVSGDTHLIEGLGLRLFKAIQSKTEEFGHLIDLLAGFTKWPDKESLAMDLEQLIMDYVSLSLVEIEERQQ